MKKIIVLLVLLVSFSGIAQDIELIKLEQLETIMAEEADQLKVINFWASWCGPCIKEMPYFDQVGQQDNVAVYFVSLDFVQDKQKAAKLIEKKNIQSPAYLLNEKDADRFITSIEPDWSGAIPATIFIDQNGTRSFYEQAFEKDELYAIVNKLTSK